MGEKTEGCVQRDTRAEPEDVELATVPPLGRAIHPAQEGYRWNINAYTRKSSGFVGPGENSTRVIDKRLIAFAGELGHWIQHRKSAYAVETKSELKQVRT